MSIVEVFSLLGGVGLFLFGMTIMSAGLKNACGDKLQTILEHATKNKLIAIAVGLGMTILVQSSSATDVMVIGFVNSGLMVLLWVPILVQQSLHRSQRLTSVHLRRCFFLQVRSCICL